MDILMGSAVVLIGAIGIAIACALLWGTIRALSDGKFLTAAALIGCMCVAAYYGKQGYASATSHFAAVDFTLDLRDANRIAPGEWNSDLKRMTGRRNAVVITPDARSIRMLTETIELRKREDQVSSVWLCSERLTSDDAAERVKQIAYELEVKVNDLDAWADRRRHSIERDPQGWALEQRLGKRYVKLAIDPDGHGFWWVGVMYAR